MSHFWELNESILIGSVKIRAQIWAGEAERQVERSCIHIYKYIPQCGTWRWLHVRLLETDEEASTFPLDIPEGYEYQERILWVWYLSCTLTDDLQLDSCGDFPKLFLETLHTSPWVYLSLLGQFSSYRILPRNPSPKPSFCNTDIDSWFLCDPRSSTSGSPRTGILFSRIPSGTSLTPQGEHA